MKTRRALLKDTVTVSTRTGEGAYGPTYADPQTIRCAIDETRRLVRDTAGDQAVSEATLTLHPASDVLDPAGQVVGRVDPLAVFTPESPVTIEGRASRVLTVKRHKVRGAVYAVEVTCA